jgi:GDPmannose 4,6-dehydratase
MAKKAFITGVTGQDGAYLLRFLLDKGYEVHALKRPTSTFSTARIDDIYNDPKIHGVRFFAHYGHLSDGLRLAEIIRSVKPDEVYHLAAQSHVAISFADPVATVMDNISGTINLLEAIRRADHEIRFYQASSSEMFGSTPPPQSESSPFRPCSPYACSKVCCFHLVVNYREAYGLHASNGILFNHESPLRGERFVTRKITRAVGRIKEGLQSKLYLGNLSAQRDWGYAGDYVEAMWLMLQQDKPDDYVIATGEMHSVREFCELAFSYVGLDYRDFVVTSREYERPLDVPALCGDASKARRVLGWRPKVSFPELVRMMVDSDLELARQEKKIGKFISLF